MKEPSDQERRSFRPGILPPTLVIPGVHQFILVHRTYLIFLFVLNIPMVAGFSCLCSSLLPLPYVDNTQHGLNFELVLNKQVVLYLRIGTGCKETYEKLIDFNYSEGGRILFAHRSRSSPNGGSHLLLDSPSKAKDIKFHNE